MLITFKLVKNSLKFLTFFTIISLLYYFKNVFPTKPRKWTLIQSLQRFKLNKTQDSVNDTKILPNVKYILIWNRDDTFDFLEKGQEAFIKNNCSFTNCYVTKYRNMIHNDYSKFHAIIFNGKKVTKVYVDGYMKLPKKRLPHQIYVFAMQDDSITYPVCAEKFDDYFNMTWTYKMNSDVNWPMFKVLTLYDNKVVAPKVKVNWASPYQDYNVFYKIQDHIFDKEFFGVWIASNCETQSRREVLAKEIQFESIKNQNILHTVGECGSKECTFATRNECLNAYDNYNFYLAFEAVLDEDYISSEILDAFDHYCVPVVYGGADYSRFLPPLSYIDARKLGAAATAKAMSYLIFNVGKFFEYYEWRTSYKIEKNVGLAACDLCEGLNKQGHKVYKHFRKWWNPDYKNTCKMKQQARMFNVTGRNKKNMK